MSGIWRKLGRLPCLGRNPAVWCPPGVAVTKWERVFSSFTGWGTVEIANQNYFVVGVL